MKKHLLSLALGLASFVSASAFNVVTVQDSISVNTHWTNNQQYLLKGFVYVTSGATLTIDAGCIIKGDKNSKGTLIVERGAQLIANGTAATPIVFTSNEDPGNRSYGDWGGVVMCGYAPVNWTAGEAQVEGGPRSLYGGTNASDNSGSLHYVRIEFAGIALSPNNEINGLTLCGVGDATSIDHIQVSYSGDDAYEFFGGTVNTKYLVALGTWDDDFDTDNGFRGKSQFCAVIRDPFAADQSGSKSFESDSYGTGTASGLAGDTSKITKPVFSNFTVIGPIVNPGSMSYDPQYVSAAQIRRGSALSILNSVIAGYPCGLLIDESSSSYGSTAANIGNGVMQFRNNIIAGTGTSSFSKDIMYVINGARNLTPTTANADTATGAPFNPYAGPWTYLLDPANSNKTYATEQNGVRLQDPFSLDHPNLVPTSTSPIVYNSAHAFNPNNPINYDTTGNYANYNVPTTPPNFSTSKANDPFFTNVNYIGAFAGTGTTSDNWMNGWCEFNPLDANYDIVSTGVKTLALTAFNSVRLYPNPATQTASVIIEMQQAGKLNVVMMDITGKVVKQIFNGEKNTGVQKFDIDLSDVNAGLYVISVNSDSKQKSVKLSVIK